MNSNYQEEGVRLGGQLLDAQEAAAIVAEVRRRVKDPGVAAEIAAFLAGKQELSSKTRDLLMVVAAGVIMQNRK